MNWGNYWYNNPMSQMPQQAVYQPQYRDGMQYGLIRVTGLDGAKAYNMPPNATAALFDSNEDLMYVKSTDGAGFPTIRTFSFTEVTEKKKEPENLSDQYVGRDEYNQFKQEVISYVEQFVQKQQSQQIQPSNEKQKSEDHRTSGYGDQHGKR